MTPRTEKCCLPACQLNGPTPQEGDSSCVLLREFTGGTLEADQTSSHFCANIFHCVLKGRLEGHGADILDAGVPDGDLLNYV